MKYVEVLFLLAIMVFCDSEVDAKPAAGTLIQSSATDGIWGSWGPLITCHNSAKMPGKFAVGYRMKSEENQGSGDDSALNGVMLLCDHSSIEGPLSSMGQWGSFGEPEYCPGDDNPVTGFRMQIEAWQGDNFWGNHHGGDDTAANNVHLVCKNNEIIDAPVKTWWGSWTDWVRCPPGQAVTGIQTRVMSPQWYGDYTALNGIRLLCEPYDE